MTEKQEKILTAALELFAQEGYRSTSTSKVAKKAGVSEGLIFRHYSNKEGLLNAILQQGEERAALLFADVIQETAPKEVIRKTLDMAQNIQKNEEGANFWKLQYKIKWELEIYGEHKMAPLEDALTDAFMKIGYEEPRLEAQSLLIYMDGLATRFYLQENFDINPAVQLLKSKYGL